MASEPRAVPVTGHVPARINALAHAQRIHNVLSMKNWRAVAILLCLLHVLAFGAQPVPEPLKIVRFRGEELPFYAAPKAIDPVSIPKGRPVSPQDSKGRPVNGYAVVTLLIDTEGKVAEAEAIESKPDAAFGQEAVRAYRQYRFPKISRSGAPTKYINQLVMVVSVEAARTNR